MIINIDNKSIINKMMLLCILVKLHRIRHFAYYHCYRSHQSPFAIEGEEVLMNRLSYAFLLQRYAYNKCVVYYYSINLSIICTAFVAAPFLMLSATTHKFNPFFTLSSRLILPTNTSSCPSAFIGIG